eukprot:gene33451-41275_t
MGADSIAASGPMTCPLPAPYTALVVPCVSLGLPLRKPAHAKEGALTEAEYDDWASQERSRVNAYLEGEGISSPSVEWPAFDMAPHFAIWAIESKQVPGKVGWWAFSGDCPTDYVSEDGGCHPRNALKLLLNKWTAYVAALKAGVQPEGIRFGAG